MPKGYIISCGYNAFRGAVGASNCFLLTCAANDTNLPGYFYSNYNFTLLCAQAPDSLLPKCSSSSSSFSSSSGGYSAAAVTGPAGSGWVALLLVMWLASPMAACLKGAAEKVNSVENSFDSRTILFDGRVVSSAFQCWPSCEVVHCHCQEY